MPPPQCPECGRFLATAFVEKIKSDPAPCPRCGTELSLAEEDDDTTGDDAAATPDETPTVPPPAATLPAEEAAGAGDALDEVEADEAEEAGGAGEADDEAVDDGPPPAGSALDAVEPEPETSVRPPDLAAERDPLAGWDESGTLPGHVDEPDPVVLAAGAGIGLLLGLLLGGREHRGLGALLGAALGAVVARLRG